MVPALSLPLPICLHPIVVSKGKVHILDLAAKLDQCAEYLCKQKWGDVEFPPPFGREAYAEVLHSFLLRRWR